MIEQNDHTTTQFFQNPGDVLLLLGDTKNEMGGSAFQQMQMGEISGMPPELDLEKERTLQQTLLEIIRSGNVVSAHDLSHGGLALALLTSCINELGITVDWEIDLRTDIALFSESQSRVLLSIVPEKVESVEASMR